MQVIKKLRGGIDTKIIKNIFWLSADKLFRLLLSVLVGAWMARYLGPGAWGKLNYVLAFISIIITVSNLGMDGFLVKEFVENVNSKKQILGTTFVLRLLSIIIMLLLTLLVFYIINTDAKTYKLFLLLYLTVIFTPFDLIDLEYQSKLQSKKTVIAKNIGYFSGAVLKLLAIVLKLKLIYFALVLGLESVFAYSFLVWQYQKKDMSVLEWKFDKKLVPHFISTGWPFFLSGLAIILYMRLDQIMLGNLLNTDRVGEFSAAVKISEMFLFIPAAISASFYPSLVEAKKNESAATYYTKVKQLIKIMFFISLAICIAVSLSSDLIIKTLYGNQFSSSVRVLQVYIWSLLAIFFGVAFNQYLVIENQQKFNLYRTLAGLAVNVGLNLFLIPPCGPVGAALATLAAQFISSVIGNFFFAKTRAALNALSLLK